MVVGQHPVAQKMNLTSGRVNMHIRKAQPLDLDAIKTIADKHKTELGFIRRPTLEKSILLDEIFVAIDEESQAIIGFVHYHHRRDKQVTLYNIAVIQAFRSSGVATQLISALVEEAKARQLDYILLKCPEELEANKFYARYGFSAMPQEKGKHRALNIWRLDLNHPRG